ncbi:MAG: hypothetical protein H0W73_16450 [Bacteroidetes bacterium]|nr:hypothetical protein [Bacteroidota bacterium]
MAVYDRKYNLTGPAFTDTYKLTEQHFYGSGRLGVLNRNEVMIYQNYNSFLGYNADGTLWGVTGPQSLNPTVFNYNLVANQLGNKVFELTNHLDNVITAISDRKLAYDNSPVDGTTDYFMPDVIQAGDNYAFGAPMPGRQYNSGSYRYGFNGKENDNDVKGNGVQQDYGMRIYDARLGKFLSVDPLSAKYPFYTPYQFAGNMPIVAIDLDGLEELWKQWQRESDGTVWKIQSAEEVDELTKIKNSIKYNMPQMREGGILTTCYDMATGKFTEVNYIPDVVVEPGLLTEYVYWMTNQDKARENVVRYISSVTQGHSGKENAEFEGVYGMYKGANVLDKTGGALKFFLPTRQLGEALCIMGDGLETIADFNTKDRSVALNNLAIRAGINILGNKAENFLNKIIPSAKVGEYQKQIIKGAVDRALEKVENESTEMNEKSGAQPDQPK